MFEILDQVYLNTIDEYLNKCKPEMENYKFPLEDDVVARIFKENLLKTTTYSVSLFTDSLIINNSGKVVTVFFSNDTDRGDCFRKITYTNLLKKIKDNKNKSFVFYALNISDKFSSDCFPKIWKMYRSPFDISFKSKHTRRLAIIRFWDDEKLNISLNDIKFYIRKYEHYLNDGNEMNVFLLSYHHNCENK